MKFVILVLFSIMFFTSELEAAEFDSIKNSLQIEEEELNPAQIFEQQMLAKKKSYSRSKSRKSARRGSKSSKRSGNTSRKSSGSRGGGSKNPSLSSGMFVK